MFFNQTFDLNDLAKIAILVVLEAVLSIDNALVLGLLAKRLPKSQRAKALTLGLVGAFGFRFISIAIAQTLLKYTLFKLLGGLYLFYVAAKYFWELWRERHSADEETADELASVEETVKRMGADSSTETEVLDGGDRPKMAGFWSTVLVIELTDLAFAVDSIVAALGLVGPPPLDNWHPKLWVVVLGGFLGVILMRYAATVFIHLLELFPRFETAAYLLVAVIGAKLTLDWAFNTHERHVLDFHHPSSPAFWIFWVLMLACFCTGFVPKRKQQTPSRESNEELSKI